ncbi:MAG TPA: OmpA family protein [Nevskiales bacterium]|nr:OmpA family protein [Nevskiales bacterium]
MLLALVWPVLVWAESPSTAESPYIGILGTHVSADEDARSATVETEDGDGIQLLYGWNWTGNLNLEAQFNYQRLETDGLGTDFYRTSLGLDAVYYFNPSGLSLYALAGLGAVENDVVPNSEDSTDAYANVGVGLMSGPLNDYGLRVRGDVRYVYDAYDNFGNEPSDVHLNLGVVIPLRRPKTVEVVRTEVKEVIKEVVKESPPADSDRDGVVDGVDRCPNTLRGAEVDQYGCVKEKAVIRLEGVHFEFDSARLTADSRDILDRAVEALRGQPSMRVEVAGHTDSIGSDAYNQRLSEARAASVVQYLVDKGIERGRLEPVGYGESQPVTGNDTEAGRARNRRVEFRIKSQ